MGTTIDALLAGCPIPVDAVGDSVVGDAVDCGVGDSELGPGVLGADATAEGNGGELVAVVASPHAAAVSTATPHNARNNASRIIKTPSEQLSGCRWKPV